MERCEWLVHPVFLAPCHVGPACRPFLRLQVHVQRGPAAIARTARAFSYPFVVTALVHVRRVGLRLPPGFPDCTVRSVPQVFRAIFAFVSLPSQRGSSHWSVCGVSTTVDFQLLCTHHIRRTSRLFLITQSPCMTLSPVAGCVVGVGHRSGQLRDLPQPHHGSL